MEFQPTVYITSGELTQQMRAGIEFEVQRFTLPRGVSHNQVRRLLTEQAQHHDWELSRVRRYRDGSREIWLRRKIIRARLTVFA